MTGSTTPTTVLQSQLSAEIRDKAKIPITRSKTTVQEMRDHVSTSNAWGYTLPVHGSSHTGQGMSPVSLLTPQAEEFLSNKKENEKKEQRRKE